MTGSALYIGHVVHRRFKPVPHRLRYRAFYMILDLDELGTLVRRLRLFSLNRFNLYSFYERDHGDGGERPLRAQIEERLRQAGIAAANGTIRVLAMPRILGMVFNPLSIYFCHAADGTLAALIYEVNNTFGERHSYLIPAGAVASDAPIRQTCAKHFYVSPFLTMALTYNFHLKLPDNRLRIAIRADDTAGPVLAAVLSGERFALRDALLARLFFRYPLLALQVLGAIHWEALKLWRKGLRLVPRPAAPAEAVSIARHARGRQ